MSNYSNTVCVIEDVKPIRKLLCTILEKAGLQTVDFPNGNSAIEWLEKNTPQAVVMDILLPDINGTEILTMIRQMENGESVPVVAVTGFAQTSDRDKYLQMGFDMYISKPINTATFAEDIKAVIKTKQNI